MHHSLHVRNFNHLPVSLRRFAVGATHGGSVESLNWILKHIESSLWAPHAHLFLPTCWANLDPARIPTPESLDGLADCTSADISQFKKPIVALEIIRKLPKIAARALADLWPRVCAWMEFLHLFHSAIPGGPGQLTILGGLFAFIDRLPVDVVDTQPGVRILIARAWKIFLATGKSSTPGFSKLWRLLNPRPASTHISPSHLDDYVTGAGGCISDLAAIVFDQLSLGHREQNIPCIQAGVRFATDVEPDHNLFTSSLCHSGLIFLLPELICSLRESFGDDGVPETLTQCLELLVTQLTSSNVRVLVRRGLLRAVVLSAPLDLPNDGGARVYELITECMYATSAPIPPFANSENLIGSGSPG
ncbi:hypothetical protein B0H16DRAFT_1455895 [Mycena metata]|uniref:Uncharacterized protein n=1 Tax=Mycena metata TaxID=1033252 RepID=A0AAD7NIQ4_9AGAR|nr:hypothetical protein B0H16DRAFT_1455895 [Mycena metata]